MLNFSKFDPLTDLSAKSSKDDLPVEEPVEECPVLSGIKVKGIKTELNIF